MGFDKNLPLKDRIQKRRKAKRKRFTLVLMFIVVASSLLILYENNVWSRNNKEQTNELDFNSSSEIIEINNQEIPLSDGNKEPVGSESEITKTVVDNSKAATDGADPDENPSAGMEPEVGKEAETSNQNVNSLTTEELKKDGNVVIFEDSPLSKNNVDYSKLEDELKAYISKFKGKYGIYYFDLVNNDSFGINESEEFTAASTFKVPLNLYIYKGITEGKINPEGTLKYTKADYEGGAGIIQNKAYGTTYTVRELSRHSLVYSDNVATRMLLRLVGKQNVKKFMRELGGSTVSDSKNISCPCDMGLYLKKVYEFCKQNGEIGDQLMNNMIETDFHDRLPLLIPKDIKIAHKTGNLIGIVHDVGIIYTDKPYILAVMSKNVVSDQEANTVIANISKKVYDYVKDR